jgi:hypothetical protein
MWENDTLVNNSWITTCTSPYASDSGFEDGRVNRLRAAPTALYVNEGGIEILLIDENSQGVPAILLTAEDLAIYADPPAVNTLIASADGIDLYILSTGEFQIQTTTPDGKTYRLIFDLSGRVLLEETIP